MTDVEQFADALAAMAKAGSCTVAEFEADPDRYIAEWLLPVMGMYAAAKTGH